MEKSSKYKLVGLVDCILGSVLIALTTVQTFILIPKLQQLYSDFNAKINPTMTYGPIVFVFLVSLANLFLGLKLLKKSKEYKESYFKLGVATAIIGLLLTLPLLGLNWVATILPIYQLTSSF